MANNRIAIFGDSITFGFNDSDRGGWVNRLSLDLTYQTGSDYSVYNRGISGDTSADILKRIDKECGAIKPDIILIAVGINDASYREILHGLYVPIKKFKENISQLYKLANKYIPKIIFIGITKVDESKTAPIPWNKNASYKNKDIRRHDLAIKEFCKEKQILFIDMYEVAEKNDLGDGLHPGAEGHKKIFQKVKQELIKNKIITV